MRATLLRPLSGPRALHRLQCGRAALLALAAAGVVCLAVLATSQAAAAWKDWQRPPGLQAGQLCSVMLANGHVYYGRLEEQNPERLRLSQVYYVQTVQQPGGGLDNRLVNRQKTDWHGPDWMSIPMEKVMLIEAVGAQSRLAQLIARDEAAPP